MPINLKLFAKNEPLRVDALFPEENPQGSICSFSLGANYVKGIYPVFQRLQLSVVKLAHMFKGSSAHVFVFIFSSHEHINSKKGILSHCLSYIPSPFLFSRLAL